MKTEDIMEGLLAEQIVSGKGDREFRELCHRMGTDLGELLDRGDPLTFETRREIHQVLKSFYNALGISWPTWEEFCADPRFKK